MKNLKIALLTTCLISSAASATTLSEALINTYQNNPELIAAREELKKTDEQMYKAISGFLPSINFQARQTRQKDDSAPGSPTTTVTGVGPFPNNVKDSKWDTINSRTSDITLQQNVFAGGRTMMAVKIAKLTIDAGRAALNATEEEILTNSIKAFTGVIYAQNILDINKENVLAFEKKYETIKERVLAGVDKQADLATTEAERANAYTNLTAASGNYETSLATYLKQVGIEAANLTDEVLGNFPANQMEFANNALRTNPSLLSITYKQRAAEIDVVSNAAALLPTVNIGGSISRNYQQPSQNPTAQAATKSKAIFIEVKVPIFNRGIEFSDTREAKATAASFKYKLKNSRASVTQASSQAWNNYVTQQQSIKSAEEAVKAGSIALEGMQQGYDEGVSSITDLLKAQTDLYQYKTRLAQVKNEAEISRYQVLSVMGTLTAKELALPTKLYNPAANYDKVKLQLIGF